MFGKFFNKSAKDVPPSTPELSPALTHSMLNFLGSRGLPTMHGAAQKAFELSINPNAEARDFVEVIRSDEALSARVLKIANSVYFDRGRKTETIEDSIVVIGLTELRSLLEATTLSELFPSKDPIRTQLWAHDVATALIAKKLASRFLPEKAAMAFTAGLMHDIGKLLLLHRAPDIYQQVIQKIQHSGCSFSKAETDLFVFDHCHLGHLIGQRWNFSEDLIRCIRCHHDPWTPEELAGERKATLVHIIKAADQIAHTLGLGLSPQFNKFRNNSEALLNATWKVLNFPENERKVFLDSAKRSVELEAEMYLQ